MSNDPNNILMGGGIPSAKFEELGTTRKGVITNVESVQQRDYDNDELLFWDDGQPRMQVVVTMATDDRDPDVEDDDGIRKLYIKGQMTKAVRDACRKAGSPGGLELGGTLAVKWDHSLEPKKKGMSGAKQYVAQYARPVHAVGDDDLI